MTFLFDDFVKVLYVINHVIAKVNAIVITWLIYHSLKIIFYD